MEDVMVEWNEDYKAEQFVIMAASPWSPQEYSARLNSIIESDKHGSSMDRAAVKIKELMKNGT